MRSTNRLLLALLAVFVTTTAAPQEIDPVAVEDFFDKAWEESLSNDGVVPGAIVTVVHNGEVLLNKGYGVSDVATGKPADPDNTRVRIGSTSKLFAALTALALVDEGVLEMDRDINEYNIAAKVPSNYDDPVTIRTLLTHRSGFDAGIAGYMSYDNNVEDLDPEVFARRLKRVRPPNREVGYDNQGLGVLGYVSGQVNETTFARSVEEKVTEVLGLEKTTMGVPDWQLEDLASCNSWDAEGNLVPCTHKFMIREMAAAGDIATTGSDMARFMIALLNGGCIGMNCVLEPDTFAQFTDMSQGRVHPATAGMGLIMMEKDLGGHFAMGHDGGQDGFSTVMTLIPGTGTGIFISQFSYGGIPEGWSISIVMDFFTRGFMHNPYGNAYAAKSSFVEEFLPEPGPKAEVALPEISADIDLSFLAGTYLGTRQIGSMLLDKFLRASGTTRLSVEGNTVFVNGDGPYVHTGGGVLEKEDDDSQLYFTQTEHDVIIQSSAGNPVDMLVKKPWHWDATFSVLPLLISALAGILGLVYALIARKEPVRRNVGLLVAAAGIGTLVGVYCELEFFAGSYYPEGATVGMVAWRLLLTLSWLAALIALVQIYRGRPELLGLAGARAIARSALVVVFGLGAVATAILLPYWGLVLNLTGSL